VQPVRKRFTGKNIITACGEPGYFGDSTFSPEKKVKK
jgi:hypothetical protein